MMILGKPLHVRGRLIRLAHLEGDKYEPLSDPEAVLRAIRQSGSRVDLFTFMQTLPHTTPRHPYPIEWDNLAVLPVTTFDHWWTKQLNNKTRNMVRRSEKSGVTVREVPFDDALVEGITAIYNETPMRQGKRFPHYGEDVETVRRISGTFPEQSTFIGAFANGELIGFAKLVSDPEGHQASLMHILSMVRHRDKAPTNALIAQAVRSCAARQIPNLVYANFAYGKKKRDTLSDFKEYNGFTRVDVPRYYVPLTGLGAVALKLQLHRGLAEHVPESVQTQIRTIRARWYSWKLQFTQRTA